MKYRLRLEKEILRYIRDCPLDVEGAGGNSVILFPETLDLIPSLQCESQEKAERHWKELEVYLGVCQTRGWITLGGFDAQLTGTGYERLDWHQDNEWTGHALRLMEGVLGSIILPIVVSVLTVFVIGWLGIRTP